MLFIDYEQSVVYLKQALDMALADGLHWVAANTYTNLGAGSGELYHLPEAQHWLREGIRFSAEHEIDFYLHYATAWLALCELYTGQWDAAGLHASEAAVRASATSTSRVMALVALGRLRLRRGDPGVGEALDTALALAEASGTLQRLAPVCAARAEWALAQGNASLADAEAAAALPLAQAHGHPWFTGELAMWRWRAGGLKQAPENCAEPFDHEIAGRWREAAEAWASLGCPYEQARALADGDTAAQQQALDMFTELGAQPAAEALRSRLRAAGVRGLARGARPATRVQPFGLTRRELEVLQLLCAGLRNAEIAQRMHRSVRTVDHHVAAVFAKLGVSGRVDAIRAAREAGLDQPGRRIAPN
jgi:ATP/maltotriose-dependent transcriptional regulator MalT